MDFDLFATLNNYSLHTVLEDSGQGSLDKRKTERIATKDSEWPEIHTITTSGIIHNPNKFGFDGYDEARDIHYEVKSSSKIVDTDLIQKFACGELHKGTKLVDRAIDGRGIFSLLTHKAVAILDQPNVNILVSAYINGVLMFIIEFPFQHQEFRDHIKNSVLRAIPNGDESGRGKTVSFLYSQYKNCEEARLVYLTGLKNLKLLQACCTKKFYLYLAHLKQKSN